jgi:hypothetical protein
LAGTAPNSEEPKLGCTTKEVVLREQVFQFNDGCLFAVKFRYGVSLAGPTTNLFPKRAPFLSLSRKEPFTAETQSPLSRQFKETLTSNLRVLCVSVVNISSAVPRTTK